MPQRIGCGHGKNASDGVELICIGPLSNKHRRAQQEQPTGHPRRSLLRAKSDRAMIEQVRAAKNGRAVEKHIDEETVVERQSGTDLVDEPVGEIVDRSNVVGSRGGPTTITAEIL